MAKDNLKSFIQKHHKSLTDPLDLARKKIAEFLEADVSKAKIRYMKFKNRTNFFK